MPPLRAASARRSCSASPSSRASISSRRPRLREGLRARSPPMGRPRPRREVASTSTPRGPSSASVVEQGAGRVVEPVEVLGHDDRGIARDAGVDVVARGLGDLFLQPWPFGGDRLVPGARRDAQQRRQQRQARRRCRARRSPPPRRGAPGASRGRRRRRSRSGARSGSEPGGIPRRCETASRAARGPARRRSDASSTNAASRRDLPTPASPLISTPRSAFGRAGRSLAPTPAGGARARHRARPVASPRSAGPGHAARRSTRNGCSGSCDAFDDLGIAGLDLEQVLDELADLVSRGRRFPVRRSPAGARRRWRRGRTRRPRRGRRRAGRCGRRRVPRATASSSAPRGDSFAHRAHQREPRPNGALGVVLVRDREPEDRQDPVALDLDDVALELGLDHLAAGGAVPAHQLAVGLGLPPPRELGRSDDVARTGSSGGAARRRERRARRRQLGVASLTGW